VPLTVALVQATPAHIYKNFPPSHKVKALSVEKTVPPEVTPTATEAPQPQTETPAAAPVAEPAPAPTPIVGCGSDSNMAYIYQHESGCNTASINASSGACGLGQAWPCAKLPCTLSDWDCQNNWFTAYAIARYGSTYNAYIYWVNHHNW